eukprot:121815-Pelagomonas_calceolata.AAC.3
MDSKANCLSYPIQRPGMQQLIGPLIANRVVIDHGLLSCPFNHEKGAIFFPGVYGNHVLGTWSQQMEERHAPVFNASTSPEYEEVARCMRKQQVCVWGTLSYARKSQTGSYYLAAQAHHYLFTH